MAIKIGINGMGRIGRMVVRSIFETQNKNLKISHINNRSNAETTCKLIKIILHFLKSLKLKILIGKSTMSTMFLNVLVNLIQKKNC